MANSLYTTVVPLVSRFMGFLPPHGKRVTADEEITVFGDLTTRISEDARKRAAFEAALDAGDLAIKNSPALFVFDETVEQTQQLTLDDEDLVWADPDWGTYSL